MNIFNKNWSENILNWELLNWEKKRKLFFLEVMVPKISMDIEKNEEGEGSEYQAEKEKIAVSGDMTKERL